MARTHWRTKAKTTKDINAQDKADPAEGRDKPKFAAIADLLVKAGIITEKQVDYGNRVLAKLATPQTLLSALEELKYVTGSQIREVLRANPVSLPLGTMLVELGYIDEADLKTALANQEERGGGRLGEILVDLHLISEDELLRIISYQLGFAYIDPTMEKIDAKLFARAPITAYQENDFIPIRRQDNGILIVFADPLNAEQRNTAEKLFGPNPIKGIGRRTLIQEALIRQEKEQKKSTATATVDSAPPDDNLIVNIVNNILIASINEGASDIHIQPTKDQLRIRFRQDGVLVNYKTYPPELAPGISSRIKIMAEADIAERRRHQDGRIFFEHKDYTLDFRVSIYSTIYGEKIVLRLLSSQSELLKIEELGLSPMMLQRFLDESLRAPSGVILVTGPTGSGKTSTLYSAINYLNNDSTSIITAEDPVEYVIDGVAQCSINPKIGVTFKETLKHIVRQDPDIIVIGEIRDKFSAEMAIEAALTGHKVLTTFHTEDSTGALIRLLNMEIEAFLVASTIVAVLAQRLVRRVCPKCSENHHLNINEIRQLGYNPSQVSRLTFKRGQGCRYCRFSGYKGRAAVHELLVPSQLVKDAVIARRTSNEIREICMKTTGLVTLLEDGIYKARHGVTSFDEIIRQLPRLDRPRNPEEIERLQGE